ncbi:MAG: hypothetical protein NVSMB42_19350 [Herpetosiphon sp.]
MAVPSTGLAQRLRVVVNTWGTTEAERQRHYPCDDIVPGAHDELWRGITIQAGAAVVFRWLCQLRAAPYSYDSIDNLGRRSPQQLIPGLERLVRGQRVMTIFELVDFARDEHITIEARLFTDGSRHSSAMSYCVVPINPNATRLLVKLSLRYPPLLRKGAAGWLFRRALAWGDLLMIRRQLLNFKHLAERDQAARAAGAMGEPA